MTAERLYAELNRLGIQLEAAGPRLRYDAPLGVLSEGLKAQLAAHKADLLALLEARSTKPTPVPLSFAQQRLWALDEISPGTAMYNIATRLRSPVRLDARTMAESLQALVTRHQALRTGVAERNGQLLQEVAAPAPFDLEMVTVQGGPPGASMSSTTPDTYRRASASPLTPTLRTGEAGSFASTPTYESHHSHPPERLLEVIDLSALAQTARRDQANSLALARAAAPFRLESPPLLRATLVQLGDQGDEVVIVTHHFVADGWSMNVLLSELASLYDAHRLGQRATLAARPAQYADLAAKEQRRHEAGAFLPQLAFWQATLAGTSFALDLPVDRIRPAVQTGRGGLVDVDLAPELARAVRAFAKTEGATLFSVLMAAFQALLSRLTGQDDFVVATAVSNRPDVDSEAVVGPCANNVLLRARLEDDPSFRQLVAAVHRSAAAAFAHQELPFERLVAELRPHRDPSRAALFQALLVVHERVATTLRMAGAEIAVERIDTGTAKFDLELSVLAGDRIGGALEYNADVITRVTAERWVAQFRRLLQAVLAQPDCPVSRLDLTSDEERHARDGWNATAARFDALDTVHRMMEAQVARAPRGLALVAGRERVTYADLNRRANRLAHLLIARRVGPDARVGVCMERSVDLVVALFATLKTGAAYVPLDPSYPERRVLDLLRDAHPRVVLTHRALGKRLGFHAERCVYLDDPALALERQPAENPPQRGTLDDLAYIIYTSGTTGTPKGAMNSHRGIANRLLWMQAAYGLTAQDRVLQKTPFSFDVSVWEFFWPLMTGAVLVLAEPGGHRDSAYLAGVITRERITTVHFVPSMLQLFLEEDDLSGCRSLRRVFASGEALSPALVSRFFARVAAELHNLYGPTEAAVDVTAWRCTPDDTDGAVPIGRPIANTQIHILDRHGAPVPVGVRGELHIGGVAVARGYWRQPELTRRVFVPDPFSATAGARLYKTGDVARYRPDGAIEYCGRLDDQVKIRGVRIEPAEVETVLARHPGVREAAVIALDGGSPRLAAAVVPADGTLTRAALRAYACERLPDALVPSAFALVASIPLSASGKVDRRALAELFSRHSTGAAAEGTGAGAIADARVAAVCRAFAEVLGLSEQEVGPDDDFFALGGDSFRAIRLARRLGGVRALDVLRASTARGLAERLAAGAQTDALLVKLGASGSVAEPDGVPLVCVPYGGGGAAVYRPLAQALAGKLNVLALALPGRDPAHPREPLATVAAMVAKATPEIAALGEPVAIYGHCVGSSLAVALARALEQQGRRVAAVVVGGSLLPPALLAPLVRGVTRWVGALVPDRLLLRYLRALGGFADAVEADVLATLMRAFRHDAVQAAESFARLGRVPRLKAPLHCLVGERDPLTRGYQAHAQRWQAAAEQVHLVTLPDAGHYFIRHDAARVAVILHDILNRTVSARRETDAR